MSQELMTTIKFFAYYVSLGGIIGMTLSLLVWGLPFPLNHDTASPPAQSAPHVTITSL